MKDKIISVWEIISSKRNFWNDFVIYCDEHVEKCENLIDASWLNNNKTKQNMHDQHQRYEKKFYFVKRRLTPNNLYHLPNLTDYLQRY